MKVIMKGLHRSWRRRLGCFRTAATLMVVLMSASAILVALTAGAADDIGTWEMRVCADPRNFPMSAQEQTGFENRVAEIVAEELNARLTYQWAPFDARILEDHLRRGTCDLVFGVGEGMHGVITTVPYARIPYVFFYRADGEVEVTSLDDEALRDLRISTYPDSIPHRALIRRGLGDNVITHRPRGTVAGPDRQMPVVEAVVSGDVDVGILYGPLPGYLALHDVDGLVVVPVTPELEPPMTPLFRINTIGVRQDDHAFRDRLDVALARRWEEIQAVLDEFGVPRLMQVPPRERDTGIGRDTLAVGVVLPAPTGSPSLTDTIADAARQGILMTEGLLDRDPTSMEFRVRMASAPSLEATIRAANRLVATEPISALIGGIGPGAGAALRDIAAQRDVLFFNIGDPDDDLRNALCHANSFHIEASSAMYIDATVEWFRLQGARTWYIVYSDDESGVPRYERMVAAIVRSDDGTEVVGSSALPAGQHVFRDTFAAILESQPDVVMVMLDPVEAEFFLGQYDVERLEPSIVAFPEPLMQSRDFMWRMRQSAPISGLGPRVALWEATFEAGGGDEINERFSSRTGQPMAPTAWSAYAAARILFDATVATGSSGVAELRKFLREADSRFDVAKGVPLRFRTWDHQLEQPLFVVEMVPEAVWGPRLTQRVALARLVDSVPRGYVGQNGTAADLGLLGDGVAETSCRLE
jgi:ABC-type branched-subunit amino acid transport system substrate-binding protein/ABC-type amino acid transport substrate-binding protein